MGEGLHILPAPEETMVINEKQICLRQPLEKDTFADNIHPENILLFSQGWGQAVE